MLPAGGRRAGVLAHAYRPQLVGLSTQVLTGWLEVGDDGQARYSPHTSKGFTAPPAKTLLLVTNGLLAKRGLRQARKHGVAERLAAAASTPTPASPAAPATPPTATAAATDAPTPVEPATVGARR